MAVVKFDRRRRRRGGWRPPRRTGRRRIWPIATLRPFAMLGVLILLWVTTKPGLVEPWGPLAMTPERVDEHFTRCGRARGHACVIDGDTLRIGDRRIRIIGIDAPETHPPRCAEEAAKGEAATARLQMLLNEGPFEMIGSRADAVDAYGRDLRVLMRDGRSIGTQLRDEGLVGRYFGTRLPWC